MSNEPADTPMETCPGDLPAGLHNYSKCTNMNHLLQFEKAVRSTPTPTSEPVNSVKMSPADTPAPDAPEGMTERHHTSVIVGDFPCPTCGGTDYYCADSLTQGPCSECHALRSKLTAAEERIATQETVIARNVAEYIQMEAERDQARAELRETAEQVKHVRKGVEYVVAQRETWKAETHRLTTEMKAREERIANLVTDVQNGREREDRLAAQLQSVTEERDTARAACCLDNTHTQHWSDGYTQMCKTHGTERTTDTGWNR